MLYPAATPVPSVTYNLYPAGKAKFNGTSYVESADVSDNVVAANDISSHNTLLACVAVVTPLLIKILATVATLVPKGLNLILWTYPPPEPAVNTNDIVPDVKSLVVFAVIADTDHCVSADAVKIGCVFNDVFGIFIFFYFIYFIS
jgi:hypothetical protein